jgi:hypothetical protein
LARIAFGLTLASLAAGLVTVLFVDIDILAGSLDRLPKTLGETIDLALLSATHVGLFASPFVAITGAIGEGLSIRALSFYLLIGVTIAFLGFSAQYASEVTGQPTILNNYAIKAFLTVGFVGGFVYWLAAGQFAGRAQERKAIPAGTLPTEPVAVSSNATDTDKQAFNARPPAVYERPRWRTPMLERLKFAKRSDPTTQKEDAPAVFDDDDREEAPSRSRASD